MEALETASVIDLPDTVVWVAGDWHGNVPWMERTLRALHRHDPDVRTVLHAGDWWMPPRIVDQVAKANGIERVLVTLGNHEPYDLYGPALDSAPGHAARISDVVWLLPRPFGFTIAGRPILSLGGAASLDRLALVAGEDWWPDEQILDSHVEAARQLPADVMITHETPNRTPVAAVDRHLADPTARFPQLTMREATESRRQIDRVWDHVRPDLLFHGHMHLTGEGSTPDGRRVIALGRDGQAGNIARLDLADLSTTLPLAADMTR